MPRFTAVPPTSSLLGGGATPLSGAQPRFTSVPSQGRDATLAATPPLGGLQGGGGLPQLSLPRSIIGSIGAGANLGRLALGQNAPPALGQIAGGAGLLGSGLSIANLAAGGGGGSTAQKALSGAQAATSGISGFSQLAPQTATALGIGAGSAAASALPYIGAALGIGQTFAGDRPGQQKILDTMAYAAAPFTFGLSALAPSLIHGLGIEKDVLGVMKYADPLTYNVTKALGSLFGEPDVPHEVREARETARHGQQVTTFLKSLSQVNSPQALYDRLARASSGAQQSIIVGVKLPTDDPGLVWSEKSKKRHGEKPTVSAIVGGTEGNFEQPRLSVERLMDIIRTDPKQLFVKVQAGVSPEKVAPLNKAVQNAIVSMAGRMTPGVSPLTPSRFQRV